MRRSSWMTICWLAWLGPLVSAADPPEYDREIRPLLKSHCLKCHGEGKTRGGLDLRSRATLLKGGDTGPAINTAKPAESLLLKAIHYRDGLEMPPSGKLPPEALALLTRWVEAGLPGLPEGKIVVEHPKGGVVTDQSRQAWPYRPLTRPPVPMVRAASWVRQPFDAFVLASLEAKQLSPAVPAERLALIRRATYDLTGLPPTPAEVDAFVHDDRPDAYERLLERLLAAPAYGEKWGRHWLDLVRFAETNGYERDGPKPYAWRFRDYVIRAFNDDKPYDRFIREQLAGDELPDGGADGIIATGYYRLGLWDDEPADPLQARFDELDDLVATTSQVFLGMTMNCARCHEHKIDPIPHADYYRLLAFFADVPRYSLTRDVRSPNNLADISPPEERERNAATVERRKQAIDALTRAMTAIEEIGIRRMPAEDQRATEGREREKVLAAKLRDHLTPELAKEHATLKLSLDLLKKLPLPAQELALAVNQCIVKPATTHVLIRGNPHSPAAAVQPGFPAVLGSPDPVIPEPPPGARTSGRRIHLANWIASPANPLTARVMANRVWQYHFGRGLVPTTSDFGGFGEKPTHPELLDWLADEFIRGGWSIKHLHRVIMTSSTYRQSSRPSEPALAADPGNRLFSRFPMRRLSAEEVRDTVLAVSGTLNRKPFGPSVCPPLPPAVLAGQSRPGEGWDRSPPDEAARRSVYVRVKRALQVPILATHDQADTDASCPVRYTTTVPTQSLGMLNSAFVNEQATALAARLRQAAPESLEQQVRLAVRLATGREPSDAEVAQDVAYLRATAERDRLTPERALAVYCLLVLNTNELIYLD